MSLISAGVTFFVLLALFPGIAGLISLYGMFADSSSIGQHLDALSGVLPEGATQVIGDQIQRLTSQPPQKLGFAMIAGLVISLWSANGGMKAMFDALNIVYHEKEKRGFIRLNAISLAVTFGAIGFVIIALDQHHGRTDDHRVFRAIVHGRTAGEDSALAATARGCKFLYRGHLSLRS